MLNKECDKNFNNVTHGGYECGKDGKWTKNCKPFYCHKNYYFDYVSQKCVKDVIAEKYSIFYSNKPDVKDEKIKELEKKVDDLDGDVSKYKGLFIFLLVVLILIVLIALFCFLKIKYGINIFKHIKI